LDNFGCVEFVGIVIVEFVGIVWGVRVDCVGIVIVEFVGIVIVWIVIEPWVCGL